MGAENENFLNEIFNLCKKVGKVQRGKYFVGFIVFKISMVDQLKIALSCWSDDQEIYQIYQQPAL